MLVKKYNFNLFADYFQFYLQDKKANLDLSSEIWTQQNVEDLPVVLPNIINVGTVRNMTVPVAVEIHDIESKENFNSWEHITECSIEIPSGNFVVAGCSDYFHEAARIKVTPGIYRVRIFYGALDTLSEDGLAGDDHYKIALWNGKHIERQVIKRRVKEKTINAR